MKKTLLIGSITTCTLIVGFWFGVARLGWFDNAIAITTAPTEGEIVSEMSRNLTEQLISDAIAYKNSTDDNRDIAKSTLEQTAARRLGYIKTLMQEDPDEFLRLAIAPNIKDELLEDTVGVETVATLEGQLQIVAGIGEEAVVAYYSLKLPSEESKQIYLPESNSIAFGPNDQVKITGFELDGVIVPNTIASPDNFTIVSAAPDPALAAAAADRKTAVIIANVGSNQIPSSFSRQNAQKMLSDTNAWYEEVSNGAMGRFTGKNDTTGNADYYGIYEISPTTTTGNCDSYYNNWRTQAFNAATADGFSSTGYQHIMIMLNKPAGITCEWVGLGEVGGNVTWYTGMNSTFAVIHELGHNIGLGHAGDATACKINGVEYSYANVDNCTFREYRDTFSAMGGLMSGNGKPAPHFHAIEKFKLGWIPSSNVRTVTTTGTYDLYPSEVVSANTQLIRIQMPYNISAPPSQTPRGSAPFYYFLEMRKPVGVESDINQMFKDGFEGVFFRIGSLTTYSMSYLYNFSDFNMTGQEPCTNCVSGLRPGMVLTDPHNPGFSIRVVSWTPDKATVDIRFEEIVEPPVCVRGTPTINLSPASSTVNPGENVNYSLSIKNNDSPECSSITYTANPSSTASGFTFAPTTKSWELAPGATGTQTFAIAFAGTAQDGIYSINFAISNSENSSIETRTASYTVVDTRVVPPAVTVQGVTNEATISPTTNTKITASATHSEGISKVEVYIDNKLIARCSKPTCDVFVKGSNTAIGTHTLRIVATANDSDQTTSSTSLTFKR